MKMTENNRMLKLFALLIAVGLWLYVDTQQDPLAQETYEVAVEMQNLPVDKTATLAQESVQVRVIGRQSRLNALRGSDFTAIVDLSEAEEGENSCAVELKLPSEVYFARVEPSSLKVQVDEREGSKMDVKIITTGTLPQGITIDELSVSPKQVFVSAEPWVLAQVASVGVSVDLANVFEDSESDTEVKFYDVAGNEIIDSGLEALPGTVTLTLKVKEENVEKTVPVQANLTGQSPHGVQIESVTVSPESVTVSGTAQEMAQLASVQTEPIDISQITETTTRTVSLTGDAAAGLGKVTVTLTVANAAEETTTESGVKVILLNISGAAASSATTDTQVIEVSYHMESGYEDESSTLSAYVDVPETISEQTTAQVQISHAPGLVVDSVSPQSVTLCPKTTTNTTW